MKEGNGITRLVASTANKYNIIIRSITVLKDPIKHWGKTVIITHEDSTDNFKFCVEMSFSPTIQVMIYNKKTFKENFKRWKLLTPIIFHKEYDKDNQPSAKLIL